MWIFFLGEWFLKSVEWKILIPFNAGFLKYVIIDVYCLYSDKNCQVTESVYLLSGNISTKWKTINLIFL